MTALEPVRAAPEIGPGTASWLEAPRTERSRWQDVADALNRVEDAGMSVGIDSDGTLTDHNAWSVVRDRAAKRWTVAGYEDDVAGQIPAPQRSPSCDHEETAPDAERVVAYRSPGGRVLRCLTHAPRELIGTDLHPVTAADLPDGGICTHIDGRGHACGVDVLIAPGQSAAAPERPGKDTPAGGEFTRDDFFRPGRTYATRSGEQFHREYMTCRPGARSLRSLRAVGWFGRSGSWSLRMFGDRSWAAGWSDITDEQQRGGGR